VTKLRLAWIPVLLAGCMIENGLPRNSCNITADCVAGASCVDSVCVAPDGGGGGGSRGDQCETFPPAACTTPEGTLHALDASELQRLLPGRWLWCTGDTFAGMPLKIGPSDAVGFEFNADATLWWFLVDDGHGNPVHRSGFEAGGTVEIIVASNLLQLNLVEGSTNFELIPAITDGPPMHLRFRSGGPAAYYVHDESGCSEPDGDMAVGTADLTSGGSFGGACDPNVVLPTSCPAVNGVACSVCGYAGMSWQCLQPCHLGGSDCTAPQSCVAVTESTRGGDCTGLDGVCM